MASWNKIIILPKVCGFTILPKVVSKTQMGAGCTKRKKNVKKLCGLGDKTANLSQ